MPYHLMNLRHVPDDEAEEIRTLFDQHEVGYYETPPSFWGISMGGFWTHDKAEAERARVLLDEYQQQRQDRQRGAWDEAVRSGYGTGLWHQLQRRPVTFLAALVAAGIILFLSVVPFLTL